MSAQPGSTTPIIRAMHPRDLDGVAKLEANTYDFPWGRSIFSDCLIAGYTSVVLEDADSVIGYAIMSIAAGEAHLLNLCVDDRWQRCGLGRQLLEYLMGQATRVKVEQLFLEVRPSNKAALALYSKAGFTQLGVRKDYYQALDGREDALVLVYSFFDE